jgi:hypothetical protein
MQLHFMYVRKQQAMLLEPHIEPFSIFFIFIIIIFYFLDTIKIIILIKKNENLHDYPQYPLLKVYTHHKFLWISSCTIVFYFSDLKHMYMYQTSIVLIRH